MAAKKRVGAPTKGGKAKKQKQATKLPGCLVCGGERFFKHTPKKYPQFAEVLAALSDSRNNRDSFLSTLWRETWYKCPWCNNSQTGTTIAAPAERAVSLSPDPKPDDVKEEEAVNFPADAPEGITPENYSPLGFDVTSVSMWTASKLLAEGYPPDLAMELSRKHKMNLSSAIEEAEDRILARLEQAQLMLVQNESKEMAQEERIVHEQTEVALAEQGVLEVLLKYDKYHLLDHPATNLVFKTKVSDIVGEDESPRQTFALLMATRTQAYRFLRSINSMDRWYEDRGAAYAHGLLEWARCVLDRIRDRWNEEARNGPPCISVALSLFKWLNEKIAEDIFTYKAGGNDSLMLPRALLFPCSLESASFAQCCGEILFPSDWKDRDVGKEKEAIAELAAFTLVERWDKPNLPPDEEETIVPEPHSVPLIDLG